SADFLRKNLVAAITELKDDHIRADFQESNRKAAAALTDYANWLERDRLPKASPDFAVGEEKYKRMLAGTELVDLEPAKVLEIGLAQLKSEQRAFEAAGQEIDPSKPAKEIFKQIQSEHPAGENLLSSIGNGLEEIRKFVVSHKLITIPSEVRARVKETPQYRRAARFASMDPPGPVAKSAAHGDDYVTPAENEGPAQRKPQRTTP